MSIMSLLSIEKTRKECLVLVARVNWFGVIVRSSSHITGCRLDSWEDLIENKRSSRDANIGFILGSLGGR